MDKNVDGVIIATPTFTHTELIKDALKAGKAVFSEKPIAENVEDTIECYNVADAMERPLLCAFNRRFDPTFKNIFGRVREGNIYWLITRSIFINMVCNGMNPVLTLAIFCRRGWTRSTNQDDKPRLPITESCLSKDFWWNLPRLCCS